MRLARALMDTEDGHARAVLRLGPKPCSADLKASALGGRIQAAEEDRREAKGSLVDLTRNIQRKKDREMESLQFAGGESSDAPKQTVIKGVKVGRNDPCPCGSGKKYKKCCYPKYD